MLKQTSLAAIGSLSFSDAYWLPLSDELDAGMKFHHGSLVERAQTSGCDCRLSALVFSQLDHQIIDIVFNRADCGNAEVFYKNIYNCG